MLEYIFSYKFPIIKYKLNLIKKLIEKTIYKIKTTKRIN